MNEPYGPGFEPENNTFYASQGPDGVFNTHARYETLSEYTAKTFAWMFAGLMVTFLVALAAYGYLTKQDLSGWAKPLFFGLIAMLIVSVVGMFVGGVNILLCCLGIVIFACYTAYDTQKIKAAYFAYAGNPELAKKASVFSALELYLDFINLFLYILRIFSRSRN